MSAERHAGRTAVPARVREWHDGEGWGVLDSEQTPGGCWASFAVLAVDGYRTAATGDSVVLEWEAFEQDGYPYRAVRFWPVGAEPIDSPVITGSPAYGSTLTWTPDAGQQR